MIHLSRDICRMWYVKPNKTFWILKFHKQLKLEIKMCFRCKLYKKYGLQLQFYRFTDRFILLNFVEIMVQPNLYTQLLQLKLFWLKLF